MSFLLLEENTSSTILTESLGWEVEFRKIVRKAVSVVERDEDIPDNEIVSLQKKIEKSWVKQEKIAIPDPTTADLKKAFDIIFDELQVDERVEKLAYTSVGLLESTYGGDLNSLMEDYMEEGFFDKVKDIVFVKDAKKTIKVLLLTLTSNFGFGWVVNQWAWLPSSTAWTMGGLLGVKAVGGAAPVAYAAFIAMRISAAMIGVMSTALVGKGIVSALKGTARFFKSSYHRIKRIFSARAKSEELLYRMAKGFKRVSLRQGLSLSETLPGAYAKNFHGSIPKGVEVIINEVFSNKKPSTYSNGYEVVEVLVSARDFSGSTEHVSFEIVQKRDGDYYVGYAWANEVMISVGLLTENFFPRTYVSGHLMEAREPKFYFVPKNSSFEEQKRSYQHNVNVIFDLWTRESVILNQEHDPGIFKEPRRPEEYRKNMRMLRAHCQKMFNKVRRYYGLPLDQNFFNTGKRGIFESVDLDDPVLSLTEAELLLEFGVVKKLGKAYKKVISTLNYWANGKNSDKQRRADMWIKQNHEKMQQLRDALEKKKKELDAKLKADIANLRKEVDKKAAKHLNQDEVARARKKHEEKLRKEREDAEEGFIGKLANAHNRWVQKVDSAIDSINEGLDLRENQVIPIESSYFEGKKTPNLVESDIPALLERVGQENETLIAEALAPEILTSIEDKEDFAEWVVRYITHFIGKVYVIRNPLPVFMGDKKIVLEKGIKVKLVDLLRHGTRLPVEPLDRRYYSFIPSRKGDKYSPLLARFHIVPQSGLLQGQTVMAFAVRLMDSIFPDSWKKVRKDYLRVNESIRDYGLDERFGSRIPEISSSPWFKKYKEERKGHKTDDEDYKKSVASLEKNYQQDLLSYKTDTRKVHGSPWTSKDLDFLARLSKKYISKDMALLKRYSNKSESVDYEYIPPAHPKSEIMYKEEVVPEDHPDIDHISKASIEERILKEGVVDIRNDYINNRPWFKNYRKKRRDLLNWIQAKEDSLTNSQAEKIENEAERVISGGERELDSFRNKTKNGSKNWTTKELKDLERIAKKWAEKELSVFQKIKGDLTEDFDAETTPPAHPKNDEKYRKETHPEDHPLHDENSKQAIEEQINNKSDLTRWSYKQHYNLNREFEAKQNRIQSRYGNDDLLYDRHVSNLNTWFGKETQKIRDEYNRRLRFLEENENDGSSSETLESLQQDYETRVNEAYSIYTGNDLSLKLEEIDQSYQNRIRRDLSENFSEEEQKLKNEMDKELLLLSSEKKRSEVESAEMLDSHVNSIVTNAPLFSEKRQKIINLYQRRYDELRSKYALPAANIYSVPLTEGAVQDVIGYLRKIINSHLRSRVKEAVVAIGDPRKMNKLKMSASANIKKYKGSMEEGIIDPISWSAGLAKKIWNAYVNLLDHAVGDIVTNLWKGYIKKYHEEDYHDWRDLKFGDEVQFGLGEFKNAVYSALTLMLIGGLMMLPKVLPIEVWTTLYEATLVAATEITKFASKITILGDLV